MTRKVQRGFRGIRARLSLIFRRSEWLRRQRRATLYRRRVGVSLFLASSILLPACEEEAKDSPAMMMARGECEVRRDESAGITIVECPGSEPVEVADPDPPESDAGLPSVGGDMIVADVDMGIPVTVDLDGDGVAAEEGDCDDQNNRIYPGARERNLDDIDSNCDGKDAPRLSNLLDDEVIFAALDLDEDGELSFEEFEAGCTESAMILGEAEPGIVQVHSACSGTNSCRGMIYHEWGELLEHDCRAVNYCAGWSCVEMAEDQGRDGLVLYGDLSCGDCHQSEEGFKIYAPPLPANAESAEAHMAAYIAAFEARGDRELSSIIAFGKSGLTPEYLPFLNMPGFYQRLSRTELQTLINHIRALPPVGAIMSYPTPSDED